MGVPRPERWRQAEHLSTGIGMRRDTLLRIRSYYLLLPSTCRRRSFL